VIAEPKMLDIVLPSSTRPAAVEDCREKGSGSRLIASLHIDAA
jgi:hypothetical protein